jgi:amino acid transporter
MANVSAMEHDELSYEGSGLPKTGNWWSAFVIGLAGTILVTGIAPVMVTSLGAAAIPITFLATGSGWLLCLFLAELAGMMPDRSGGSPSYAYVAFKDKWPHLAEHVNGITAWGYWLGWFPVGPLNMILASFYIADLFKLNTTSGISLLGTPIAWWTIAISVVGLLLLFIPSYRGLRFGAAFATVLAFLSMIPLTFLAISWIFHPSVVHFGQLTSFHHVDGSGFFASQFHHGWLTLSIAFGFLLTWNVIAMEAAACYIGECKDPDRDAKIAMNLEGGYGVFIYTLIPIAFVIVLGVHALGNTALVDPKTMFVTFASKVFGASSASTVLDWLIGWMLILALVLSALNAVTGTARSLHQMATDGHFPKFFTRTNSHGVPGHAMAFNIFCMIIVVFMGGAVQIYTFSNVGYLFSFIPVLIGYYLLRKYRPNVRRPFRLPEWMKYAALGLAAVYTVIYVWGGPVYADCACNAAGKKTLPYYFIGIGVLLAYLPLYWYRKRFEDKREPPGAVAAAQRPPGAPITAAVTDTAP